MLHPSRARIPLLGSLTVLSILQSCNSAQVTGLIVDIVAYPDPVWQDRPQWPFPGQLRRESHKP